MPRVRVQSFAISLDGFAAGPSQSIHDPNGVGGLAIHEWVFGTRTFKRMHGDDVGETGVDDDFVRRGITGIGSWIIGRNMFGPVRGPWPDDTWNGWWGPNPPFHCPVVVLTHHPRASVEMDGGTTFHFVTGGIHEALKRASDAAPGQDVRIGGGVSTVRQYLQAGLVDEMHLAIAPVLLGAGEHLLRNLDLTGLGFRCVEQVPSHRVTHVVLARTP